MSPPLFRVAGLAAPGATITLAGSEGHHAADVMRVGAGESIELTDGAGGRAECVVRAAARSRLECRVIRRADVAAPAVRFVVVQALAKGDRFTLALELATELGADEILPWAAARSVARAQPGPRAAKALDRWRATVHAAAKQSRRAWFPSVAAAADTVAVRRRIAGAAIRLVLHAGAAIPLSAVALPAAGEVAIVVGPEGGITADELAALGGHAVRLGPEILRTSTAAGAALAALACRAGRWD